MKSKKWKQKMKMSGKAFIWKEIMQGKQHKLENNNNTWSY
jgi:hypothetical protein